MNFRNKDFLLFFTIFVVTFVSAMATLNYVIDPRQKLLIYEGENLKSFHKAINDSSYGTRLPKVLSMPKFSLLFNHKGKEQVIIGNSQTYLVGYKASYTPQGYSPDNLINVSLANLGQNEFLFFLDLSQKVGIKKAFVILPHHFHQTLRLERWPKSIREEMSKLLDKANLKAEEHTFKDQIGLLKYFFSFRTLWETYDHIRSWKENSLEKTYIRPLKEKPDIKKDYKSFVLKNGATSWSSKWLKNVYKHRRFETEKIYKELKGELRNFGLYEEVRRKQIISALEKIFKSSQEKGMEIDFFIGPIFLNFLHPVKDKRLIEYYEWHQKVIVEMANRLGIKVYGGYDQCPEEMYDFLHPFPSCLERVLKNQLN